MSKQKDENQVLEMDKLSEVHNEVRTIEQFFEFLSSKGVLLCKSTDDEMTNIPYMPIVESDIIKLIYENYDIDGIKLEQERRELLESIKQ